MTDLPHKVVKGKHGNRGFELEPDQLNRRSDLLTFLRTRRSTVAADIAAPGPDAEQLALMLEAACRVPDHGKLTPWRFIVFRDEGKEAFAVFLTRRWRARHPEAASDASVPEATFVSAAPLVIAVVSGAFAHPKIPEWEQRLSAGAACHNLLLAAQGMGLAAQWRTGWPAYDEEVHRFLELAEDERIAGFIYVGTRKAEAPPPTDRRRPFWRDRTSFFGEDREETA